MSFKGKTTDFEQKVEAHQQQSLDENDVAHNRLSERFRGLSSETQAKLDGLARDKGYDGFMGMAHLFWKQKIYPYFAKALYGPQQGFEDLLQRLRDWARAQLQRFVGSPESAVPSVMQDDGADQEVYIGASMVKDLISIFEGANLTPEQTQAVLRDFCAGGKVGPEAISHNKGNELS